jgi:hypothetical protein
MAFLADDVALRKLGKQLIAWRGRSDLSRVQMGLAALATHGSDMALLNLGLVAAKSRNEHARAYAKDFISDAAATLGLTEDGVADRTVPDMGLGADGTLLLDYGPRQFIVRLDEVLQPHIYNQDGGKETRVPTARKTDDKDLVKAAKAAFKDLKDALETLGKAQLLRLERAMIDGRTWSVTDFQSLFVDHPLMNGLSKRLLWSSDGQLFRVAEDGTYADVDDEQVEVIGDVSLIHRIRVDPAQWQPWSLVFGDYEIIQPFAQLARPIYHAPPALEVDAWPGVALGVCDSRGWVREYDEHAENVWGFRKVIEGQRVTLRLSSEIGLRDMDKDNKLKVSLREVPNLSAVQLSELIGDIEALRA